MTTIFDKIYVLSLTTNKIRQKFIQYQMNELGLDFEFIYGTDFSNIKYDSRGREITYPRMFYEDDSKSTAKDFGCAISHYQAILQAYEFGYDSVLILEDDICLLKDKQTLQHYLLSILDIINKSDFITFDPRFIISSQFYQFQNQINSSNDNYVFLDNSYDALCGGMMYGIMNKETMKLYLEKQHNSFIMSDHIMGIFFDPVVRRYVCKKCLCTDQLNINFNFNLNNDMQCYKNIYYDIENLNVDNFYIPNENHIMSRDIYIPQL